MPANRLHAFVGTDEARVKEAALQAVRKLSEGLDPTFSNDVIDGQAENAEAAVAAVRETIQAIRTVPFLGGEKVVWLKSATFFADGVVGGAQSVLDAAEQLAGVLAEGIPEGVSVVLSAMGMDKRRSFWKQLNKLAKVEVHDKADISKEGWERTVVPAILARARSLGLGMDEGTAELFVGMVGNDSSRLHSELEKLRTFAGAHGEVNEDDVRLVVSKSRGGIVFEIGNAVGNRDLPRALATLQHFLFLQESPVTILRAGIVPKVRTLLAARELIGANKLTVPARFDAFKAMVSRLPNDAVDHLPRNKSGQLSLYPLFLASRECRRFKLRELVEALEACLEADRQLVHTTTDGPLVLSRLLHQILKPAATPS